MSHDVPGSLFEVVGEDGLTALVHAFYGRVAVDDILRPMYPDDDLAGAEARLRDFLVYRLGGPPRYIERRGHPRLRMRHAPFAIDVAARDRWMALMGASLVDVDMPDAARNGLRAFLGDVATFLINREG